MNRFRTLALAGMLFTAPLALSALEPYQVADIDPTFRSGSSSPNEFVRVGSRALFLARTPNLGLWSSNGTAAGTVRLLRNQVRIEKFLVAPELAYYVACDPQGCRLYRTDGTVAGTRRLGPLTLELDRVVAGPRRIFWNGSSAAAGAELWTSDGTVAGTRMVKDLTPGPANTYLSGMVWSGNRLWFFALGGLWTSDGTNAGTRRIATVGGVASVAAVGSRLVFFSVASETSEARLWTSDGTAAGTRRLSQVPPQVDGIQEPFAVAATNAFFVTRKQTPTENFQEVWVTDGTATKTRRLATFPAPRVDFSRVLVVGDKIAFRANDGSNGDELWVSDGKLNGTRQIELCPGSCSGLDDLGVSDGRRAFFSGASGVVGGSGLWLSDLTPEGTRQVSQLSPGGSFGLTNFIVGIGGVFFGDGRFPESLWFSDGTAAGTRRLVAPLDVETPLRYDGGISVGSRAFFGLSDPAHGSEPWISDGTVAGTVLLTDLDPKQVGGSFPYMLAAAAGRSFFFAYNDSEPDPIELWTSDGTTDGTELVWRFEDGSFNANSSTSAFAVTFGSKVALTKHFEINPPLWVSDGTTAGTTRIDSEELHPTGRIRALGNLLFFEAEDNAHGVELWVTDGSPTGAIRLTDLENFDPFLDEVDGGALRVLGSRLVFFARDSFDRPEPWVSDGTIGGTRRLAEVHPALVASFFTLSSEIAQVGSNYFYISGGASGIGRALWVSDLSSAGTREVGAIRDSFGNLAGARALLPLGGRVLVFYSSFSDFGENGILTSDGTALERGAVGAGIVSAPTPSQAPLLWNGRWVYPGEEGRVWMTDGTIAGTTPLIANGGEFLSPAGLASLGNVFAFANFAGIWQSDGTPAGTVRILSGATAGSLSGGFLRAGERIFFPWHDGATGTELWALRAP